MKKNKIDDCSFKGMLTDTPEEIQERLKQAASVNPKDEFGNFPKVGNFSDIKTGYIIMGTGGNIPKDEMYIIGVDPVSTEEEEQTNLGRS